MDTKKITYKINIGICINVLNHYESLQTWIRKIANIYQGKADPGWIQRSKQKTGADFGLSKRVVQGHFQDMWLAVFIARESWIQ